MNKTRYAATAVALLGLSLGQAFGLGKNPSKRAEVLREQQRQELAKAAELEKKADALNNAVSGKNGQKASDELEHANTPNAADVVKGVGQAATGNTFGQVKTAVGMAQRTLPPLGKTYDASLEVADPKMTAELEKARDDAEKAKKNANLLGKVAGAVEQKVSSPTTEPKAQPKSNGGDRSGPGGGLGKGDAREFHGNDRAAEKASRTS